MASPIARIFAVIFLVLMSGATTAATKNPATSAKTTHRLLIQVNQNDPEIMNLALNNATNVIEYYHAKGEEVIEHAPTCPFCLEEINVGATRCPHCTAELPAPAEVTIEIVKK